MTKISTSFRYRPATRLYIRISRRVARAEKSPDYNHITSCGKSTVLCRFWARNRARPCANLRIYRGISGGQSSRAMYRCVYFINHSLPALCLSRAVYNALNADISTGLVCARVLSPTPDISSIFHLYTTTTLPAWICVCTGTM